MVQVQAVVWAGVGVCVASNSLVCALLCFEELVYNALGFPGGLWQAMRCGVVT